MEIGINFMKTFIFLLLAFLINFNTFAGTCSTISYTSNAANTTLTSTKYNTDNSTAYDAINSFDGGCTVAGSLEKDALDATVATGFAVPLNGIVDGCKVTKATAATLDIGNCIAAVNNNWVKTATTTSVAWTDLDTGGEAASTYYYVYIDSASTTTTLTPVISVTAPGSDGLNGSDRAIARFYNDSSSDIISTLSQWLGSKFESDRVYVRFDTDAGQSMDNSSTEVVNFDSKTFGYESHPGVVTTGAGWVFTAPIGGVYHVSSSVALVPNMDAGEQVQYVLYKNGSLYAHMYTLEGSITSALDVVALGSTDVDLLATETISARLFQNSGAAVTLKTDEERNFISIHLLPEE